MRKATIQLLKIPANIPFKCIQVCHRIKRLKWNHSLDLQISLRINYAKIRCLFWLVKLNPDYLPCFRVKTSFKGYTQFINFEMLTTTTTMSFNCLLSYFFVRSMETIFIRPLRAWYSYTLLLVSFKQWIKGLSSMNAIWSLNFSLGLAEFKWKLVFGNSSYSTKQRSRYHFELSWKS